MISARNAHVIHGGNINTATPVTIQSSAVDTYTYNVGYYDDTKIKERISLLESEVSELQSEDENFKYRLSLLESNESKWATKTELSNLETRVDRLYDDPVGLTNSQMNEILN